MDESIDVDTAALVSHARTLTGLVGELRAALDAARSVSLSSDAYGETARPAAVKLESAAQDGQAAIKAGVDAVDRTGAKLRDSAAAYENRDSAEAARMARVEGEVATS
ncbi:uncharacterized protein YukE [Kibdelosporangium banguiense]|uniref:Uncharacterized protein YukE n=1 Tax=Kibdelosporangium banguiense TaxID=1365924 RepID=A0ABS4TVP1_9PSEU|nr:type VII secretion target [Kibdelosporangium banguiense]MBP2327986.1 uncharacterized protein YukE [Kibdelosporangium banguiense]